MKMVRVETTILSNCEKIVKLGDKLRGNKRKNEFFEASLCLHLVCRAKGKRHFANKCHVSNANTKETTLDECRRAKKARLETGKKGHSIAVCISHHTTSPQSSVFKASFGNNTIERDLKANQSTRC